MLKKQVFLVIALLASHNIVCFAFVLPDPFAYVTSNLPTVRNAIESDTPGATNPNSPLIFPAYFSGEIRATPLLLFMSEGKAHTGTRLMSFKDDLEMASRSVIVDFMVRLQFGRLSLRANQYSFFREYGGRFGTFYMPEFRFGADLDIVNRNGIRFGLNVDGCTEGPHIDYNFSQAPPGPPGPNFNAGSAGRIDFGRPLTMGVHFVFNPPVYGGFSSVFELRAQWPLRSSIALSEYEIAGGIKSPPTVFGSSALRLGWRAIELTAPDNRLNARWNGAFLEYVFYY